MLCNPLPYPYFWKRTIDSLRDSLNSYDLDISFKLTSFLRPVGSCLPSKIRKSGIGLEANVKIQIYFVSRPFAGSVAPVPPMGLKASLSRLLFTTRPSQKMTTVHKSYHHNTDPIIDYCSKHTVQQHPLQLELQEQTLKNAEMAMMLGAPEVLTVGANFIKLVHGKKAIDVGTFTGASALAWALAMPDDGKVYTLDVSHDNYRKHGLPIINKCTKTAAKINAVEGPALEFLDKLISEGQEGTFDFAFIDADKNNYSNYYERCVQLLKPGGVILVDNALWSGRVANYKPDDAASRAIDELNKKIFNDKKTNSFLVNCGDGIHVAFKI